MSQWTPSHGGSTEAAAERDASPTVAPCGSCAVTMSRVMPFTNLGSTSILLRVWEHTIWPFLEAGGRQMNEWLKQGDELWSEAPIMERGG